MPHDPDPLLSIAAVAREIGVDRSTLAKQVRSGGIRSHDGKVRLSEVLEDRAANIDLSRSKRREGCIDEPAPQPEAPGEVPAPAEPIAADDEGDREPVVVDGAVLPYAEARAMKETYIARLRKLQFDKERGELAPVAAMIAFNERVFGVVRERLLAVPGKLSGDLEPDQVERVTAELHEALEELSDPRDALADLDAVADEDADDDGGAAPAAPPQPRGVGRAAPLRRPEDERRPR